MQQICFTPERQRDPAVGADCHPLVISCLGIHYAFLSRPEPGNIQIYLAELEPINGNAAHSKHHTSMRISDLLLL
jgi:hypothetical protein